MSNGFAYFALFFWPLVTLVLYRRMPVGRATLWSILGAYLLLPSATEVDLPMVPPLDKFTVSNLSAFLVCRFMLGKRIALLPNLGLVKGLLLVYIASPFVTAMVNSDPIVAGPVFIKGMTSYDALSAVIRQLLFIAPFVLGMNFVRDAGNHEELLRILAIAALAYSLPMLFEVRMSPQLHRWIYGFFPHSFAQHKRLDGFRPVVFMGHGLLVAFFTMSALVAAVTLSKIGRNVAGYRSVLVAIYLGVVLLLCKSLASVVYAVLLISLIGFGTPRLQTQVAKLLVVLVISYPMLRTFGWFPVAGVEQTAYAVSEQRGRSLQYRLDNEELLLAKARRRALFGWGSWGRNRVYDMKTGKDLSVTDGRWIIVMGQFGWVGYIAEFGLLMIPVVRCSRVIRYVEDKRERIVLAAVASLMAVSVLDLLPNSTVTPWTWLLAGALLGRVERIKSVVRQKSAHSRSSRTVTSLEAA